MLIIFSWTQNFKKTLRRNKKDWFKMGSKPRVVIYSIVPRLAEAVKKLLPEENLKVVEMKGEQEIVKY